LSLSLCLTRCAQVKISRSVLLSERLNIKTVLVTPSHTHTRAHAQMHTHLQCDLRQKHLIHALEIELSGLAVICTHHWTMQRTLVHAEPPVLRLTPRKNKHGSPPLTHTHK